MTGAVNLVPGHRLPCWSNIEPVPARRLYPRVIAQGKIESVSTLCSLVHFNLW